MKKNASAKWIALLMAVTMILSLPGSVRADEIKAESDTEYLTEAPGSTEEESILPTEDPSESESEPLTEAESTEPEQEETLALSVEEVLRLRDEGGNQPAAVAVSTGGETAGAKSVQASLLLAKRLKQLAETHGHNMIVFRGNGFVYVRKEPAANAAVVGKMYYNSVATVLNMLYEEDGLWLNISSGSVEGYVRSELFVRGGEAQDLLGSIAQTWAIPKADAQRLYKYESTASDTIATLSGGQKYKVLSVRNGFTRLFFGETAQGAAVTGYVPNSEVLYTQDWTYAVTLEEENQAYQDAQKALEEESLRETSRIASSEQESRDAQSWEDASRASAEQASREAEEASRASSEEASRAAEEWSRAQESIHESEALESSLLESSWLESSILASSWWASWYESSVIESSLLESSWLESSWLESSRQAELTAEVTPAPEDTTSWQEPTSWQETQPSSSSSETETTTEAPAPIDGVATYGPIIPETTALRRTICLDALQYVDKLDYVWCGESLVTGADCSGFLRAIFANYGIDIAHYSYTIAKTGIKVMSLEEAQPGDILCFRTDDEAAGNGHVGLYLGNGLMVHSPSTGRKVCVVYFETTHLSTIQNVICD